jgi:hypothetical protein
MLESLGHGAKTVGIHPQIILNRIVGTDPDKFQQMKIV